VKAGLLAREDGQTGPEGGKPTATWQPVESNHESNHAAVFGGTNHAPEKQSRSAAEPQVRAITEPITAITHQAITNLPPSLEGAGALPEEENRPPDDPLDAAVDVATRLLGGTVLTRE